MRTMPTSRIIVSFGVTSAVVGLLLERVERGPGRDGGLRWTSTLAASAAAGWIVGRRERGATAVLAAGEAGLGVGAVDGALRAVAMRVTHPEPGPTMPLWAEMYIMAGMLGVSGSVCGGLAGLVAQGVTVLRRL